MERDSSFFDIFYTFFFIVLIAVITDDYFSGCEAGKRLLEVKKKLLPVHVCVHYIIFRSNLIIIKILKIKGAVLYAGPDYSVIGLKLFRTNDIYYSQ